MGQQQQYLRRVCKIKKVLVLILALAMGLATTFYLAGPPLFSHLLPSSCPACICQQCPSTSPPDCNMAAALIWREDVDKNSHELLKEELMLKEVTAEENEKHSESVFLDAKKMSSQYQKEAEKCSVGLETCEEVREKVERALAAEKKVTEMWEKRATEMSV